MLNFKDSYLKTAGAYVTIGGLYPFAMESKLHNGYIPVVRLGGHVDEGETGWECAQREVFEEANIRIRPAEVNKTFWVQAETTGLVLREIRWDNDNESDPKPCLVVTDQFDKDPSLSLMYLAQSDETPVPSHEMKGILLLNAEQVQEICQTYLTLGEYLKRGGTAILRDTFNQNRRLEPSIHLRILAQMMKSQKI